MFLDLIIQKKVMCGMDIFNGIEFYYGFIIDNYGFLTNCDVLSAIVERILQANSSLAFRKAMGDRHRHSAVRRKLKPRWRYSEPAELMAQQIDLMAQQISGLQQLMAKVSTNVDYMAGCLMRHEVKKSAEASGERPPTPAPGFIPRTPQSKARPNAIRPISDRLATLADHLADAIEPTTPAPAEYPVPPPTTTSNLTGVEYPEEHIWDNHKPCTCWRCTMRKQAPVLADHVKGFENDVNAVMKEEERGFGAPGGINMAATTSDDSQRQEEGFQKRDEDKGFYQGKCFGFHYDEDEPEKKKKKYVPGCDPRKWRDAVPCTPEESMAFELLRAERLEND